VSFSSGPANWHDLIDQWRIRQLCAIRRAATMAHPQAKPWSAPMSNAVTQIAAASPKQAAAHFEAQLTFETDCWDTHEAIRRGSPGFVLLDVRSPALFAKGHVPGAVNLPHAKIIASKMNEYPKSTLFVTYCAGPHCNGAARGAARLARLGFAVKMMAGGMTGWIDEGFELERL
jgi:rhodanese-related sulfurtransferase